MNTTTTPEGAGAFPPLADMIHDLVGLYAQTTQGVWRKGQTTHHTVIRREGELPYRIAEFRHANDAAFCDAAHAFMPALLAALRAQAAEGEQRAAQAAGQIVTPSDDARNARGASFSVEDLKLPLPALPDPFIASTDIGYALHRAPEVLRFGADCYRLALAATPAPAHPLPVAGEEVQGVVPTVEQVERELWISHHEWHEANPNDIIRAVLRLAHAAPAGEKGATDALRHLVSQIEKSSPVDDHGHLLTKNIAFINAKGLL